MRSLTPLARLGPVVLLGLLGLGPSPAAPARPAGKKVALLVGVARHDFPRLLADVESADNDVDALAKALGEKGSGFTEVRVLSTARGKKARADAPTRANVQAALAALLAGRKEGDLVLVVLVGHAPHLTDPDTRKKVACFCPADAVPGDPASMIGLADVVRALNGCRAGQRLLLVNASRPGPVPTRAEQARLLPLAPGTAVLFACSPGEEPFEMNRRGRRFSLFAHYFLEGLRGEARDRRDEVTWATLAAYVSKRVPEEVRRQAGAEARQSPQALGEASAVLRSLGPETVTLAPEAAEQALLDRLNKERAKARLPALTVHPTLARVARAHALNMARQHKMAHELDGKTAPRRVDEAGYDYRSVGENVAKSHDEDGEVTPDVVHAGLMKSKVHRDNILAARFREVGVGVAIAADGRAYYAQVFGTRRGER